MSWIHKLYETYEACAMNATIPDSDDLCPVGYSVQNAHVEVVLDDKGHFRRANLVQRENNPKTFIPVTEKSSGRTSGEAPHPLCDSLQYCAADYQEYGGARTSYYDSYITQLKDWADSPFSHPKVKAIYAYAKKGKVVEDLSKAGVLAVKNKVLVISTKNAPDLSEYLILKLLTFDDKGTKDQAKVFIRWSVESTNEKCTHTWEDNSLFESWRNYLDSLEAKEGFCYVTGKMVVLAQKHPGKLRNGKDGAKLISSNDKDGYTFLGRFLNADQTVGVSSEVTQKAHSALRWLIGRKQAFRSGDQVVVSWAVRGSDFPALCENTLDFLGPQEETTQSISGIGDVGQAFANRLNKKISGYRTNISDSESIVVIGLDSATPGRMAITFYRELTGSEFLQRIEQWHSDFSWEQNFGKELHFIGAPAPKDIAWAAYGM
jgi:CRISPR-associated protein Csd1